MNNSFIKQIHNFPTLCRSIITKLVNLTRLIKYFKMEL